MAEEEAETQGSYALWDLALRWTVESIRDPEKRDGARRSYMRSAASLENLGVPGELRLTPGFTALPHPSWVGFEVNFTLQRPWFAKDDSVFHVLDNPLRKDRVFGVPYMSASSWKGLLRWAYLMEVKLIGPRAKFSIADGDARTREVFHLFGEKGTGGKFQQGALAFYPTWFDRIGFEVINPHNRRRRAGTQPIYFEVVPEGARGDLRLLYAPVPGSARRSGVDPTEALGRLMDAIEALLTSYGISAKRTAGWGTASIGQWKLYRLGEIPCSKDNKEEAYLVLQSWLALGDDTSNDRC